MPVAELQVDVEGLAVAGLGLVEPPLLLGDHAELVVGAGGGVPVAELQVDVEGLAVAGLGLVEPPLLLGDPAELVVGDALASPVAGGLQELELGLVVRPGVVEAVLVECRIPGEVVQQGEFAAAGLRWRAGVGGDGVVEELAPGCRAAGPAPGIHPAAGSRPLMGWPVRSP